MAATPITASYFLSSLGVNTHVGDPGVYSNLTEIIADLQYLGISQIRDGTIIAANDITLAQAGITFDFLPAPQGGTTASLDAQWTIIDQIAAAVPGSVHAIEGANEINDFSVPFNWNGQTTPNSGDNGAIALQQTIYSMVKADPALANTAVYYFTGYDQAYASDGNTTGMTPLGPDPATTSGLANFDIAHLYPGTSWPYQEPMTLGPGTSGEFNLPNEAPSYSGPAVWTEFGYTPQSGMSQANVGIYTLDGLLDAAQAGVSATYIYELVEDGGDGYGLFSSSNAATPAATDIHNLTTFLADPGTGGVAPTPINDTITGLPSGSGNSLVIEKSNGTFEIAVWNEATGTTNVTVAFGGEYSSVEVYNPVTGATSTHNDVSSVSLSLSNGAPEIVQLIGLVSSSGGGSHHHHGG